MIPRFECEEFKKFTYRIVQKTINLLKTRLENQPIQFSFVVSLLGEEIIEQSLVEEILSEYVDKLDKNLSYERVSICEFDKLLVNAKNELKENIYQISKCEFVRKRAVFSLIEERFSKITDLHIEKRLKSLIDNEIVFFLIKQNIKELSRIQLDQQISTQNGMISKDAQNLYTIYDAGLSLIKNNVLSGFLKSVIIKNRM